MNKKVEKKQDKKKRRIAFWWWSFAGVIALATLITLSLGLPTVNQGSASSSISTSVSSNLESNQLRLIAVEVYKLPTKTTYTPVDTISTSGGELRLVYSDNSVKYVAMNDAMIDYSRFNTTNLGTNRITLAYSFNQDKLFTTYNIDIVPFAVLATNLVLDINSSNITLDQVVNLNILLEPTNATYSNLVWTSSNPLVATVDSNGLVTPKNVGNVVITATLDGRLTANSNLTVVPGKPIELRPTLGGSSGSAPNEPEEPLTEITVLTGVQGNTIIPIYTHEQLNQLRPNSTSLNLTFGSVANNDAAIYVFESNEVLKAHYILMNDINLVSYESWVPIGTNTSTTKFTGTFDGNDKTISNMNIDVNITGLFNPGTGLFANINSATIKDFKIENFDITASTTRSNNANNDGSHVGLIAGRVENSSVVTNIEIDSNSSITTKNFSRVGGAIGEVNNSIVNKVVSYATISSNFGDNDTTPNTTAFIEMIIGGIIGWANPATVSEVSNFGTVNARGAQIGGLIGRTAASTVLSNSGNYGQVTGGDRLGGLIGRMDSSTVNNSINTVNIAGSGGINGNGTVNNTYSNNFFVKDTNINQGTANDTGITGITIANAKIQSTFTGWDFVGETTNGTNEFWSIDSSRNNGYPYLTWLYPALATIANVPNDNVDINLAIDWVAPTTTATDDVDGDISANIVITYSSTDAGSNVTNLDSAQTHLANSIGNTVRVIYTVLDSSGNPAIPVVAVFTSIEAEQTVLVPPNITDEEVTEIAGSTVNLVFTTDNAGIYYYIIMIGHPGPSDSYPSVETVKEQNSSIYFVGTGQAVEGPNSIPIQGLFQNTPFAIYFIVEATGPNPSLVEEILFTTIDD
jgi:hypothetical protein